MNPYNTPVPRRPWWKSTPAALGMLVLVALLSAFSLALGFLLMITAMVLVWVLPPWRWYAKLGSMFGAIALLTIGAGIGGQLDDGGTGTADAKTRPTSSPRAEAATSPTTATPLKAADYTGERLDRAEERARSAGFTTDGHDAGNQARSIVLRSGWTVCFQKADATAKVIHFAAVRADEPCPDRDGGPLAWPEMPDVVGQTYNTAVKDLKQAGIGLDRITLDDVYLDIDTPTTNTAAHDGDEWRVCFQSPDRGSEVTSTTSVRLDLGRWTDADTVERCPATKDTTYKIPANDPNRDSGNTTPGGNHSSSGGSTGGGSSSSNDGGGVGTVHPGAFCSPSGVTGVTTRGTPMVCRPGSDGRDRWHS
nr:PASTA domain-containing protein [Streptomyces sp. NBC_00899]